MSNPDKTPTQPIGAIRISNTGSRKYQQIKVETEGGPKWVYLHRQMMAEHLGRPLTDDEIVKFKPNVNPLNFMLEDLELVERATPREPLRVKVLQGRYNKLRFQLTQIENELKAMGYDIGADTGTADDSD